MLGTGDNKQIFKSPLSGFSLYDVELYTNKNLDKNAPYFKAYKRFILNDPDPDYFVDSDGVLDESAYQSAIAKHKEDVAKYEVLVNSIKNAEDLFIYEKGKDLNKLVEKYEKAKIEVSNGNLGYLSLPTVPLKKDGDSFKMVHIKDIVGIPVNIFQVNDTYNGTPKPKIGIRFVDFKNKEIYDLIMSENVAAFDAINSMLSLKDLSVDIRLDCNGVVMQRNQKIPHFYSSKNIKDLMAKDGKNYSNESEREQYCKDLIDRSSKSGYNCVIREDRIYYAQSDIEDVTKFGKNMDAAYGFAKDEDGERMQPNQSKKNKFFMSKLDILAKKFNEAFNKILENMGYSAEFIYNDNKTMQRCNYIPLGMSSNEVSKENTSNEVNSKEDTPF